MKTFKLLAMVMVFVVGCSSSSEQPLGNHAIDPMFVECASDNIGAVCIRDDDTEGVCVAPRKCLTECDTVTDCEYPNGECVDGFCWYSRD